MYTTTTGLRNITRDPDDHDDSNEYASLRTMTYIMAAGSIAMFLILCLSVLILVARNSRSQHPAMQCLRRGFTCNNKVRPVFDIPPVAQQQQQQPPPPPPPQGGGGGGIVAQP
eukprot:TRINITY_DN8901_c0_g1_i2.p1 TRINITY_DN8901_c0_g1~~TRINITY_DN8901_c0_g1_i2.p1  ORF type:complete len:124 (+),score=35.48 TRINITY_DN8901_c0_g1_i2:34-372(+)